MKSPDAWTSYAAFFYCFNKKLQATWFSSRIANIDSTIENKHKIYGVYNTRDIGTIVKHILKCLDKQVLREKDKGKWQILIMFMWWINYNRLLWPLWFSCNSHSVQAKCIICKSTNLCLIKCSLFDNVFALFSGNYHWPQFL